MSKFWEVIRDYASYIAPFAWALLPLVASRLRRRFQRRRGYLSGRTARWLGESPAWSPAPPNPEAILSDDVKSVLLLGTSHARLLSVGFLEAAESWLAEDAEREIGMLFLAPFGPHAYHRKRRALDQSGRDPILHELGLVMPLAARAPRFTAAIYDGPYRYSACAWNLAANGQEGRIDLVTSTHVHGLARGFRISLDPKTIPRPYEAFRYELLELWRTALANPAGHGISLVGYSRTDAALSSRIDLLMQQLQSALTSGQIAPEAHYSPSRHLFDSDRLHVTLTSLCRTQRTPESLRQGPLVIERSDSDCPDDALPAGYGNLLADVLVEIAKRVPAIEGATFSFDKLTLDERGYLSLTTDARSSEVIEQIDSLVRDVAGIADRYIGNPPRGRWRTPCTDDNRFKPKYAKYLPHVTVGRLFDESGSLPRPMLVGEPVTVSVEPAIGFCVTHLYLVHYAYRSLLRCVGRLRVGPRGGTYEPQEVLYRLGIRGPDWPIRDLPGMPD